ncbi:DUF6273 domain-containing protein [uncultured Vagococcus sp.]|uniref:DUF6273 domain-containing protein n=1 Tax=uncultured Vagococcus sp. TaxID=189676 RepID=UPI00258ECF77|nr:DUF6273 domain-containing protein [uncultured Vagococcus sp.]
MTTRNKKRTVGVAAGLATLLLVTGTFAWTSISQQALNEKSGKTEAGGRIHDDYNKESGNKDIYAENYSKQNLIVRVKLSEYMENNQRPMVAGTSKTDKKTWTPYTIPGSTSSEAYRQYVTWTLGGSKNFLPTFNTNNDSKATDAAGDAIDVLAQASNPTTPVEWQTALGDGSQDYFTDGQVVDNPSDASIKHTVKPTLTQGRAPISMATWKALPEAQKQGNYWVVDTDGWAYWANELAPSESTSLLLDQLNWNSSALGNLNDWYYGIDVIGEFATKSDVGEFDKSEHGKPSDDAKGLLQFTSDNSVYTIDFTSDVTNVVMKPKESRQFDAKVTQDDKDIDSPITWSLTPTSVGTIDQTGKVTINDTVESNTNITVTAKTTVNSKLVSNSFTIKVEPDTIKVGEIIKFNGEDFIYLKDLQDGNRLVLRKELLPTNAATSLTYNGSALDQAMKAYYNGLSTDAKEEVQPIQSSFVVGQPKNDTAVGIDANRFLVTNPTSDRAVVTPTGGEKKAFALSLDELNDVSGPGKAFPNFKSREAFIGGTMANWWLRSPNTSAYAWYVNIDLFAGKLGYTTMTTSFGVRPALIINR